MILRIYRKLFSHDSVHVLYAVWFGMRGMRNTHTHTFRLHMRTQNQSKSTRISWKIHTYAFRITWMVVCNKESATMFRFCITILLSRSCVRFIFWFLLLLFSLHFIFVAVLDANTKILWTNRKSSLSREIQSSSNNQNDKKVCPNVENCWVIKRKCIHFGRTHYVMCSEIFLCWKIQPPSFKRIHHKIHFQRRLRQ